MPKLFSACFVVRYPSQNLTVNQSCCDYYSGVNAASSILVFFCLNVPVCASVCSTTSDCLVSIFAYFVCI